MNTSDINKKYKRPKKKTQSTTNPETSRPKNKTDLEHEPLEPLCPLLAKDSEWVDILQSPLNAPESSKVAEDEAVLQLVECEDGPQMKPLAIMFPGLLEKDPETLEGMLTKAMSTTEVTKHLVDLGEKANFTFMKKSNRLIPPDKQWLESVSESNNSHCSLGSGMFSGCASSDYEADNEFPDYFTTVVEGRKKKFALVSQKDTENQSSEGMGTVSGNADPNEQVLAQQSVMENLLTRSHKTLPPENNKKST